MSDNTAILVVNGGEGKESSQWLRFCIERIVENTEFQNYRIYVWNNNVDDKSVDDFCKKTPKVTLIQSPIKKEGECSIEHANSLQMLYDAALRDNPEFIVTMDTDAHPLKGGWLKHLISRLDSETVLAGVWRDELEGAINPYIHPSCFCTTVEFINKSGLRFDEIPSGTEKVYDTLSIFTEWAQTRGKDIYKLRRSNRNNFHFLMGGIYGDIIYHHSGGSRGRIGFWGTKKRFTQNKMICVFLKKLLFKDYERYIGWLRGDSSDMIFRIHLSIRKNIYRLYF